MMMNYNKFSNRYQVWLTAYVAARSCAVWRAVTAQSYGSACVECLPAICATSTRAWLHPRPLRRRTSLHCASPTYEQVRHHSSSSYLSSENYIKQDHQALLKAKYCPRVAAESHTQQSTKKPCDLDLWLRLHSCCHSLTHNQSTQVNKSGTDYIKRMQCISQRKHRATTNILTKIRNFRDLRTCQKGPKSDQKGT